MAHQSLYRRYRPRRFSEVRGQEHVVKALRNAVATDTVGHAYLFSGPRGTGKTSTARILAKALNCEDLRDGEPCCECGPCVEMEAGRSFDLFELDAASNNGVDSIRDLVDRAAVGSPGRTKVYILDEVHMLSTAASNALLKTLEEPPGHVCFVLATTDPQKVLPTIRSRTQHYEFQLLSSRELTAYVHWIAQDAPLDIDEESVAHVVRAGRGSARDTLSSLDQVVAAGGVITRMPPVEQVLRALAGSDTGAAVVAVSDALDLGHDPRVLAETLLGDLRDAFLLSLGADVAHLVDSDAERLGGWAQALGTPRLTRAMEAVGAAIVEMRQAADPRVPLEVALVRLCSSASPDDGVIAELVRRIEALERSGVTGAADGGRATDAQTTNRPVVSSAGADAEPDADDRGEPTGGGPAAARAALGALRAAKPQRAAGSEPKPGAGVRERPAAPRPPVAPRPSNPSTAPTAPAAVAQAPAAPASARTEPGASPDRDALTVAFGDVVLPGLKGVAKAIYGAGRFVDVTDRGAVFELSNAPTRERAERFRPDVEAALSAHFGSPVHLVLSVADDPGGSDPVSRPAAETSSDAPAVSRSSDEDESSIIDVHELEDADVAATGVDRLTRRFPGAVLVEGTDTAG